MLTQLSTVKARLGIAPADTTQDTMLALVIEAVSTRFARECCRTFERTVDATFEFPACETAIVPMRYPIESVAAFHLKSTEAEGWVLQEAEYLIRRACVLALVSPLGSWRELARVTYTGGFVLPGAAVGPGQTALPKDLEHAATEQVAVWYQNRDKLGLIRHWPSNGTYLVLSQQPLLSSVSLTLRRHQSFAM